MHNHPHESKLNSMYKNDRIKKAFIRKLTSEGGPQLRRNYAGLLALFTFIFFLSSNALCSVKAASNQNGIYLDAKGAILIEQGSVKVLYQRNDRERLYPASTTKILTALVALENGSLEDTVTVGKEVLMVPWDSSKAYLKEGEQVTFRELILGLMLPSGNDAAATIGVYIGRVASGNMSLDETIAMDKFAELMNERARKAGANNSNFVNPHGYHDKNHYTTPHDLALITKEAMKIEFFKEVVNTFKYNAEGKSVFNNGVMQESIDHTWRNSNELINKSSRDYYEFATGVKTGYTSPAGFCVVSTASRDGMDLIAVVLGSSSQNRWEDSKKLLNYGFENYKYYKGAVKDQAIAELKVDNHSSNSPENLTAVPDENFADAFDKEDASRIRKSIVWDKNLISTLPEQDGSIKLLSSIESGQVIGKVVFTLDENVLKEINLKALEGVKKQSIMNTVTEAINTSNILWFFAGVICGAAGILILLRRAAVSRRRRMSINFNRNL